MKIVFVCVGNMCRSPLVEQMFSAYLRQQSFSCEVSSAGLMNHVKPMSRESEIVLRERGIVPEAHQSALLTQEDVDGCDVIVAMTDRLRDKVVEHHGHPEKVLSMSDPRLLGEEVPDPCGLDISAYRAVAEQFDRALPRLLAFLKALPANP